MLYLGLSDLIPKINDIGSHLTQDWSYYIRIRVFVFPVAFLPYISVNTQPSLME